MNTHLTLSLGSTKTFRTYFVASILGAVVGAGVAAACVVVVPTPMQLAADEQMAPRPDDPPSYTPWYERLSRAKCSALPTS